MGSLFFLCVIAWLVNLRVFVFYSGCQLPAADLRQMSILRWNVQEACIKFTDVVNHHLKQDMYL